MIDWWDRLFDKMYDLINFFKFDFDIVLIINTKYAATQLRIEEWKEINSYKI